MNSQGPSANVNDDGADQIDLSSPVTIEFVPPATFLMWDTADVVRLRKQCRIVTYPIGTRSTNAYQNQQLSMPCSVPHEAIYALLNKGATKHGSSKLTAFPQSRYSVTTADPGPSNTDKQDFSNFTSRRCDNAPTYTSSASCSRDHRESNVRLVQLSAHNRFPTADSVVADYAAHERACDEEQRQFILEESRSDRLTRAEVIAKGRAAKRRKIAALDETLSKGTSDHEAYAGKQNRNCVVPVDNCTAEGEEATKGSCDSENAYKLAAPMEVDHCPLNESPASEAATSAKQPSPTEALSSTTSKNELDAQNVEIALQKNNTQHSTGFHQSDQKTNDKQGNKKRSRAAMLRVTNKDLSTVTVTQSEIDAVLASLAADEEQSTNGDENKAAPTNLDKRLDANELLVEIPTLTPFHVDPMYDNLSFEDVQHLFEVRPDEIASQIIDKNYSTVKTQRNNKLLRCVIYADLWSRPEGFYITEGLKFGCDFLVYPGDPVRYHAAYMVICVPDPCKSYPATIYGAWSRVSTQVNKTVLFAFVDSITGCVRYISCDWVKQQ